MSGPVITTRTCGVPENCAKTGKPHDWSGKPYERKLPSGAVEGGATCADCGVEYGNFLLWSDGE